MSNASCCQPALLCDIYAVNSCLCPPLLVSCMQCVVGGRGGGQGVCLVVSPALAAGGGENTLEYAVCAPSAICVFLALLTPGHSTHAGRTSELRLLHRRPMPSMCVIHGLHVPVSTVFGCLFVIYIRSTMWLQGAKDGAWCVCCGCCPLNKRHRLDPAVHVRVVIHAFWAAFLCVTVSVVCFAPAGLTCWRRR